MEGGEMIDGLKPCPFCGGEAELQKILGGPFTEDATRVSFRAACKDLECQGGYSNFWHTTPEDAMAAWNRRAERTCRMEYNEEWSGDELYPTEAYACSECGHIDLDGKPHYCRYCGARVKEGR